MELLLIAAAFVAGAFWRRWFGGWPKPPAGSWLNGRGPKIAAGLVLGFLATWPALPWWAALVLSGLVIAYWLPGHKLQEWGVREWLLRYGPPGLYWWAANRWPRNLSWGGGLVDGTNALAELAAGGTVYAAAAGLAIGAAAVLPGLG